MENNRIYCDIKKKIRLAQESGHRRTTILIFKPKCLKREGVIGALVDKFFGPPIDYRPITYDSEKALQQIANDGFKITYKLIGDRQTPYCQAIADDLPALN